MDLETPRLKLEPYDDSHYEGLRVMDSDAGVMRYITGGIVKTPEETWEDIRKVQARWDKYHFYFSLQHLNQFKFFRDQFHIFRKMAFAEEKSLMLFLPVFKA